MIAGWPWNRDFPPSTDDSFRVWKIDIHKKIFFHINCRSDFLFVCFSPSLPGSNFSGIISVMCKWEVGSYLWWVAPLVLLNCLLNIYWAPPCDWGRNICPPRVHRLAPETDNLEMSQCSLVAWWGSRGRTLTQRVAVKEGLPREVKLIL